MWLAHTMATMGLTVASGHMGSRGTSKVVAGDGSLCRQAITYLKPGGRVTTCIGSGDSGEVESHSVCSTCKCSSTLWSCTLLAPELLWCCLYLNLLKAGGACPVVVTNWEGCSTFSQLGNQFRGVSTFTHFSCGNWGVVGSSGTPLMGAASSMVTSPDGMSVKVGRASPETVNLVQFLRNPSEMMSSEKETYHSIISCNWRADLANRHG